MKIYKELEFQGNKEVLLFLYQLFLRKSLIIGEL